MSAKNVPEPTLAEIQMAFAGHIRNPDLVPPPGGIEDRRMQIYRKVFFNNISQFLAASFPVMRKLYDRNGWSRLVRDFYAEHRARTPLFPELPKEFLRYLQEQRQDRPGDPPFLLELAHYEWVEQALALDDRELDDVSADPKGDMLEDIPVLSPLAWPLSYRFPVHRIGPEFQPRDAPQEATHLLAYRNRVDRVKFMHLNEVTRYLLALMQSQPELTGNQLLTKTAARIGHPTPETVVAGGKSLFQDLYDRDILLGARPRRAAA